MKKRKRKGEKGTKPAAADSWIQKAPVQVALIAFAIVALRQCWLALFLRTFPIPTHGIIIISGASSGIGRAICGYIAERHPSVTMYCGIRDAAAATSGPPFTTLPNVQAVVLDVTNATQVQAVMEQVQTSGLPLIGLINNAGYLNLGTVEFQDPELFQKVFDVNVFGSFRLTQVALPLLRQVPGSRILFTSSLAAAVSAATRHAAYCGSKQAVGSMADALRTEVAPLNISVSIIEPGYIDTVMTQNYDNEPIETSDDQATRTVWEEKRLVYPHIYNEKRQESYINLVSISSPVNETCAAMEHALFSERPLPRYQTARLGPLPGWLFAKVSRPLPDSIADIFKVQFELTYQLARMSVLLEDGISNLYQGLLGLFFEQR